MDISLPLVAGVSDRGLMRRNNQDRWGQFGEGKFLVVADGMGGHQAGEVAAQEVVDRLGLWYKSAALTPDDALEQLYTAVKQVNHEIFSMAYSDEKLKGMGTTLCCLLFVGDRAFQCHVGDSRIYRLREGRMEQLTRDDSLVADLLDIGQLEPQDVADYEHRNVVTRAIAMEPDVEPHVEEIVLQKGDLFLICSDGLTQMLEDRKIKKILQKENPLESRCRELVKATKEKGARDNVTVLLAALETNDLSR